MICVGGFKWGPNLKIKRDIMWNKTKGNKCNKLHLWLFINTYGYLWTFVNFRTKQQYPYLVYDNKAKIIDVYKPK